MDLIAQGHLFRYQTVLFGGDLLLAVLALWTSGALFGEPAAAVAPWHYGFVPGALIASFFAGLYGAETLPPARIAWRSALAAVLTALFLAGLSLLLDHGVASWAFGFALSLFFIGQTLWKLFLQWLRHSPLLTRNLLIIGTGPRARRLEQTLCESFGRYRLRGFIGTPNEPVSVNPEQVLGPIDAIVELAAEHRAHAIVIALTERRGNLAIDKLVACKLNGARILDYPSLVETLTGKIPVEDISPSWLVQSSGFLITPFVLFTKRIVDILLAALLLIVALPVMLPSMLVIKLTSPGPVFYLQRRVGMHGKSFTIFKFRSMTVDAERATGATWAAENDPRVTPFGAIMRKTRIDELPQLFNVLKGDMSFIGPRPERPEFVEQIAKMTPYYRNRHAVKPGITGWAQVMYPYGASFGDALEKLRYDLYYVKNLSFFLEVLIVLETVKVVLFRKGGR